MNGVDNYSMEEENIYLILENALKYFEHIASSNYWNYMPGPEPGFIESFVI